jgi:hypothetical protein
MGGPVMSLGRGLDGTVTAMCTLPSRSLLIVVGSFTRALNLDEPFEIKSGGLAVWQDAPNVASSSTRGSTQDIHAPGSWEPLAASVHGVPSAVLCNDAFGQVIVGGEVSFVASESAKTCVAASAAMCRAESSLYKSAVDKASKCATQCDSASGLNGGTGLAMFEFEQRTWRALAGVQGVVGGQVLSIATSADDLYIGGDFASVAGVSASGLAICKHFRHAPDAEWLAVAALDGSVWSVMLHTFHTHLLHIHGFQKQMFTTKEFKQHHGIIWRQHLSCRRLFPCQRASSTRGQVSALVTTKPAGKHLQSASVS